MLNIIIGCEWLKNLVNRVDDTDGMKKMFV